MRSARAAALGWMLAAWMLAGWMLAGSAHAQPDNASAWFDRGVEALQAGRYAEAATAFREAHRLDGSVASLCNLAVTYDRWGGHEAEAADAYQQCAAEDTTGRYRGYAERRSRELAARLRESGVDVQGDEARAEAAEEAQAGADGRDAADGAPPMGDDAPAPEGPAPASPTGGAEGVDDPSGAPTSTRSPARAKADAGSGGDDGGPGPMLWIGIATGVAAVGVFTGGAVLARRANDDADVLDERYDGGRIPIPVGSEDLDRLEDARHKADLARVLYGVAGGLGAAAAALIIVDLATGGAERDRDAAHVGIAPQRGGALFTAALRLR